MRDLSPKPLEFAVYLFITLLTAGSVIGQYSPQTYPDPRIDPIGCKITLPGQVCDPSEILLPEERRNLIEKIAKLQGITANIKNTSPACSSAQSNLYIMVALVEKLGTLPYESVSIERFTNTLRSKYQNYQDVSLCDTMVLIMNSRMDRQVFTVAGRDAKLSREVLQTAFHRNVGHFRSGNYALGLEGMVEYIGAAYSNSHIIQVPSPTAPANKQPEEWEGQLPSAPQGVATAAGQFITHGVRQKPENGKLGVEKFNFESIPEEDRLWVQIMQKATQQCGYDPDKIADNVRAIIEEAMSLSLKMIADPRYNKLEEEAQDFNIGRDKAWLNAKSSFIDQLYVKWAMKFPRRAGLCPATSSGGEQRTAESRRLQ